MPPAEADTPSEPETMAAAEPETPEAPALSAPVAPEVSAEPEPAHHIPLGSTVYIGEKEYELLAYGGENVTLYDPDCPLFHEVLPRSEFDAKLAENPLNSHLFAADAATLKTTEQAEPGDRPGAGGTGGRPGAGTGPHRPACPAPGSTQAQQSVPDCPAPGNPRGAAP